MADYPYQVIKAWTACSICNTQMDPGFPAAVIASGDRQLLCCSPACARRASEMAEGLARERETMQVDGAADVTAAPSGPPHSPTGPMDDQGVVIE